MHRWIDKSRERGREHVLLFKGETRFDQSIIQAPTDLPCPRNLIRPVSKLLFFPSKYLLWELIESFYLHILCRFLQNYMIVRDVLRFQFWLTVIPNFSINPFKANALFMGHWQTVENQIRHHRMRRLLRFCTVCLQNVLLKFEWNKNLPPNNPYIQNGFVQMIKTGKATGLYG